MSGFDGGFETRRWVFMRWCRAAKVDRALRARCYQFAALPPYFTSSKGLLDPPIQTPPRPGHDPKVLSLYAFPDRSPLPRISSRALHSPELRRYVILDFSEMKASDNPTNLKARLLCDVIAACAENCRRIVGETHSFRRM